MTIDTHAHYFPPALLDMLETQARSLGVSFVKQPPQCQCALHFEHGLKLRPFPAKLIEPVAARLAAMDRRGSTGRCCRRGRMGSATACRRTRP